MKNRKFALHLALFIAGIAIVFSACRKINEATELGGDLIPVVDNITTFDTTLNVETYSGIFDPLLDSTSMAESATHFLGRISNDPVFGQTNAKLFLELKPDTYKWRFNKQVPDSLHIDSVVLILSYVETYGDTNTAQTVNVYEIDQSTAFKADSNYKVTQNSFTYTNLLGSKTFFPRDLKDSVKVYKDTTNKQLRIRLNDAFGTRLLNYDTVTSGSFFGAYQSDSAFKTYFKGFALESTAGNAIMGFDLLGANTKLAIYYRDDNNGAVVQDTLVDYFKFTVFSAFANYVTRTHHPNIVAASASAAQDNLVYISNTPGTFATIKIPGLATLSNRVIHRAELIMEQEYDPSDTLFAVPNSLMLDAYDPDSLRYRTIPYDMAADGQGALTPYYFGGLPFNALDGTAKTIKVWRFVISRYVQQVVTQKLPVYQLRVLSPFYVEDLYGIPGKVKDLKAFVNVNPTIAKGRVKLHGGSPASNPQRMRLRIIYSKL